MRVPVVNHKSARSSPILKENPSGYYTTFLCAVGAFNLMFFCTIVCLDESSFTQVNCLYNSYYNSNQRMHTILLKSKYYNTSAPKRFGPHWYIIKKHTYLLTPWGRVLLEKPSGFAASQEIPRIYGTRKFITVFTSVRHLSLSWAPSTSGLFCPQRKHLNSWILLNMGFHGEGC
jgi:hypothetical protein